MPWVEDPTTVFVNPYNFVPLVGGVEREEMTIPPENFTGKITCQVTLKTPMAMPDHERKDSVSLGGDKKHYIYPFMQQNGRLVIPGSEIRGAVRSVFEAATSSCLGVLDEKPLHARFRGRILDRKPGLLHFNEGSGNWELYDAEVFLLNTMTDSGDSPKVYPTGVDKDGKYVEIDGKKYYNGDKLSFNVDQYTYQTSRGFDTKLHYVVDIGGTGTHKEGYLLIGELGLNSNSAHRHNSHIFVKKNGEANQVSEADVDLLQKVLDCYRDEKINGTLHSDEGEHSGYAGYEIRKGKDDYLPVWYQRTGNHYVFSTARQGRELYVNTLPDLAGEHSSCKSEPLCPACRLFGMVKDESFGSRVRFTDAVYCGTPEDAKSNQERVMLKELASPKVSAYEFYLKRPKTDARVWTPDYIITQENRRTNYFSVAPELRGRKFYFHHSNLKKTDYSTTRPKDRTERNCTVDILKKGTFRFEVFFDRISEEELQQLLWALSPVDGEKDLCLKLGLGKPLGLGSVKTTIEKVLIRDWDGEQYRVKPYDKPVSKPKECPEELLKILDFNCIPGNHRICYPLGEDTTKNDANSQSSHQWFAGNRASGNDGNATNPNSKYVLPALKGSLLLPKLVKIREKRNNNFRGRR